MDPTNGDDGRSILLTRSHSNNLQHDDIKMTLP